MTDVFISYAHRDEEFPDAWVSTLHSRLERAIEADYPNLGIEIHRDDLVFRKSIGFEYQIRHFIENTGVLLCIVSPSYVDSTYCQIELDYFVKRPRFGGLVRVVKKAVKITSQPEALQNLDGFNFFDEGGSPLQAFNQGNRVNSRFDHAIMPLAQEIVRAVEFARAPRQRVLLLSARERADEHGRILNELRESNLEVLTEAHLPADRRDWPEALRKVDFALFLLGLEYSAPIETAYHSMAERCEGPQRRCLCSTPSPESQQPAQLRFLQRVRDLNAKPGYVCLDGADVELLLSQAKRYLKALQPKLDPTPTLFLSYPKSARQFAADVRAELRDLNQVLAPDRPLHLADAYGDGDAASLKTQPGTRDSAGARAHGGLLLQERPGAFLAAALAETESFLLPSRTGKPIAVYPASAQAVVPGPILEKYPAIVREGHPPYPFIGNSARRCTLTAFLQNVYTRATAP